MNLDIMKTCITYNLELSNLITRVMNDESLPRETRLNVVQSMLEASLLAMGETFGPEFVDKIIKNLEDQKGTMQ